MRPTHNPQKLHNITRVVTRIYFRKLAEKQKENFRVDNKTNVTERFHEKTNFNFFWFRFDWHVLDVLRLWICIHFSRIRMRIQLFFSMQIRFRLLSQCVSGSGFKNHSKNTEEIAHGAGPNLLFKI